LFSTPVPKPVTLAPLQMTVLPDCTHAASAGPAGTTAVITVDKASGAARVSHCPALTFAVNSGRAAPSIFFISYSQLSRPKQPPPAN
jgi:hypothetical protein